MKDPNTRAPGLLERYREEMLVMRYAKRAIRSDQCLPYPPSSE
jgi:hypothetical protein